MKKFFINMIIIMFIVSCGGKKEIKQLPSEVKDVKKAFEIIDKIKNAYTKKDMITLKKFTTKKCYLYLISSIKEFDKVKLNFVPQWVDIKNNNIIIIYIEWNGIWKIKNKQYRKNGFVVFKILTSSFQLDEILRANPFSQPE